MKKVDWIWMPHAAHLIVGPSCQFHLATYVGEYIVSTVGEYWPDRQVREIHAEIHDPAWFATNRYLKGDSFDHAYMKQFGFEDIGASRKYETMVFVADADTENGCCAWVMRNPTSVDFRAYDTADEATKGHMELCEEWSAK